MSRRARPILKATLVPPSNPFAVCPRILDRSPHVHFPPTPAMSSIHATHSSMIYDRTPLITSPNVCALPARGERNYSNLDSTPEEINSSGSVKGSYFHPRAYEACEREKEKLEFSSPSLLPPLTHSSPTSDSDESDSAITTPPDPYRYPTSLTTNGPDALCGVVHSPLLRKCSRDDALAFLPHATVPSSNQNARASRPNLSPSRRRSPSRCRPEMKFESRSAFAAPRLDDCLGGF